MARPSSTEPDITPLLIDALAETLGQVEIDGLVLLTGGASRETWSFDAVDTQRTRTPLIMQRNRGGTSLGVAFDVEDRLLTAATRAGVPIPEVVVGADGCAKLGSARITRRIEGETLAPRIIRGDEFAQARLVLTSQMAAALASIHSIPVDEAEGLAEDDPLTQLRFGLDMLGVVSPAFELALRWLEENRPAAPRRTVVHGDFRVGNLMVDQTGLLAVLDWELAHLGDPIEDLGWLCVRAWRFGGEGVVGGIGDVPSLLAAYKESAGVDVTEDELRWWVIAGTLRWGMICAVQASQHLNGHVKSVELVTIGRRITENEHDLLDLLGVARMDPERPLPIVDHGRSSAAELVAAVRDHLSDRVMPKLAKGDAFKVRVATNALAMVERELAATAPSAFDIDEPGLASRIRSGEDLNGSELAEVRAAVTARIMVSNPSWVSAQAPEW